MAVLPARLTACTRLQSAVVGPKGVGKSTFLQFWELCCNPHPALPERPCPACSCLLPSCKCDIPDFGKECLHLLGGGLVVSPFPSDLSKCSVQKREPGSTGIWEGICSPPSCSRGQEEALEGVETWQVALRAGRSPVFPLKQICLCVLPGETPGSGLAHCPRLAPQSAERPGTLTKLQTPPRDLRLPTRHPNPPEIAEGRKQGWRGLLPPCCLPGAS